MGESFFKYERMRDQGVDPVSTCRTAFDDGIIGIECVRLLRAVFSMTVQQAVEVYGDAANAEADRAAASLEPSQGWLSTVTVEMLAGIGADVFLPMSEFSLKYRFTDPKWNLLPKEYLTKIRPFSVAWARRLRERSIAFLYSLDRRVDLFTQVLHHDADGEPEEITRSWLQDLPSDDDEDVVISWNREDAVLAPWGVFVRYWDDFCYPFENVVVWPLSENWVLQPNNDARFRFGVRVIALDQANRSE